MKPKPFIRGRHKNRAPSRGAVYFVLQELIGQLSVDAPWAGTDGGGGVLMQFRRGSNTIVTADG